MEAVSDNVSEVQLCVVCFERTAGAKLHPCGHDYFCQPCTRHFRTCPLCRAPLVMVPGGYPWLQTCGEAVPDSGATVSANFPPRVEPIISSTERRGIMLVILTAWVFIFLGGILEFSTDIPSGCAAGDPVLSTVEAAAIGQEPFEMKADVEACETCSQSQKQVAAGVGTCYNCKEGFKNFGGQCFKYIENFPSVKVGAKLGGTTYFSLIILTQIAGISSELYLIRRLRLRNLMPRKELIVLILALIIEITRMLLVDVFMLMDYFSGRSYRIFRAPLTSSVCIDADNRTWQGSDGRWYCNNPNLPSQDTQYYLASHQAAFSLDSNECTTFLSSSALLNFKESAPSFPNRGAPRFENLGWVIGGEFALYYFFATFVNEIADNMFVVPTTTNMGWFCKIFSVALEIFQLGALAPAAIFTHNDCIHYTDPLGVSLHTISFIAVTFGYCCWAFVFLCIPLAGIGLAIYSFLFALCGLASLAALCLLYLATCSDSPRLTQSAELFSNQAEYLLSKAHTFNAWMRSGRDNLLYAVMLFAFIPLLLSGMFLGCLVIVGQSSKRGTMSVLTALVLLSDVLLKVGATAITEIADYVLHVRVRRAVASSSGQEQRPHAQSVGHTIDHADHQEAEGNAAITEFDAVGDAELR